MTYDFWIDIVKIILFCSLAYLTYIIIHLVYNRHNTQFVCKQIVKEDGSVDFYLGTIKYGMIRWFKSKDNGKWVHVAILEDINKSCFYIDGELIGERVVEGK
jgi:hypothetical protein